jgi:hypothetical protein
MLAPQLTLTLTLALLKGTDHYPVTQARLVGGAEWALR